MTHMAAETETYVSADDLRIINRILLDGCDVRIVRVPNGVKIQALAVKTVRKTQINEIK